MMDPNEFALGKREFERIRDRLYEVAGISLSDAKETLVIARLSRIVRTLKLNSFDAYMDYLERQGTAHDAQESFSPMSNSTWATTNISPVKVAFSCFGTNEDGSISEGFV